ncbi:MAG TPA: nucleoside recognition domain-containing protein [Cytophagaceae bacterium]
MVLNYIWIGFFVIAFAVGLAKLLLFYLGYPEYGGTTVFTEMMKAAFDMAKVSVMDIGLPLIGLITFFMGIMKIGEKSGVVNVLAKIIGPFFSRVFPQIPKDHPAVGFIMMNFAANMLGLDNAATPMGLKAMKEMQELNTDKDTASDSQIMFLVLNTSGLTIIPITIMNYRSQAGAQDPSDIFIPLLIATTFSTLAGLIYVGIKQKINFLDKVFLAYVGGILLLIAGVVAYFSSLPPAKLQAVSSLVSNFILFALIIAFIIMGFVKKIDVFSTFIDGAKDGFEVVVKLIPYLVGFLVAIALFRTCGALDFLLTGLRLAVEAIGFDSKWVDAMPTAFMKPLSGGGARAMMIETMNTKGADSFAGRLSSIFQGAADTTFFILAVYFGSVGIKKTRYSVAGGLIADMAGVIAAIWIAYIFFD